MLFIVTLAAAAVHTFAWRPRLAPWLVLVSIGLLAIGGAVEGIREQREFHRNADSFETMASWLADMEERFRAAADMESLRVLVQEAATLLFQENRDWFGTMRFQDIELHV